MPSIKTSERLPRGCLRLFRTKKQSFRSPLFETRKSCQKNFQEMFKNYEFEAVIFIGFCSRESRLISCAVCERKFIRWMRLCVFCQTEGSFTRFFREEFDPVAVAYSIWSRRRDAVRRTLTFDQFWGTGHFCGRRYSGTSPSAEVLRGKPCGSP